MISAVETVKESGCVEGRKISASWMGLNSCICPDEMMHIDMNLVRHKIQRTCRV